MTTTMASMSNDLLGRDCEYDRRQERERYSFTNVLRIGFVILGVTVLSSNLATMKRIVFFSAMTTAAENGVASTATATTTTTRSSLSSLSSSSSPSMSTYPKQVSTIADVDNNVDANVDANAFIRTSKDTSAELTTIQVAATKPTTATKTIDNPANDDGTVGDHGTVSFYPVDTTTVRSWGCGRSETPFVFVHLGKAGGGNVRKRIDSSSVNFHQPDGTYFPINDTEKGFYCNSCFNHRFPHDKDAYEGVLECHATSPPGIAIACPETIDRINRITKWAMNRALAGGYKEGMPRVCYPNSQTCHFVYAGHNMFGSEIHWLPGPYLQNWWNSLSQLDGGIPTLPWDKLDPDNTWCQYMDGQKRKNANMTISLSRPRKTGQYIKVVDQCVKPIGEQVDDLVMNSISVSDKDTNGQVSSWAGLYASLPSVRVTVMRNPFSWLVSKYLWHTSSPSVDWNTTCDDLSVALPSPSSTDDGSPILVNQEKEKNGWMVNAARQYIFYLCGVDCAARYASGKATLEDIERQADQNLRHGFAVVGILEDLDTFYEMITARVSYINATLGKDGDRHSTNKRPESLRCKTLFKTTEFQNKLIQASPEVGVMKRLYDTAVEVNRFQMNELRQCAPAGVFTK